MLNINIKDIGKKPIEIGNVEGSENAVKISKLNLNTGESQEKPLDITVIPANTSTGTIKVAYLPLSAGMSVLKKIDTKTVDPDSVDKNGPYQYCDMCSYETPHYVVKDKVETKVVCYRCSHGYSIIV